MPFFQLYNQTKVALLQEQFHEIQLQTIHHLTTLTRTINSFPLRETLSLYLPPSLYFFVDLSLDICEYYTYEVCILMWILFFSLIWSFYKSKEESYRRQLGKCWKDLVAYCEVNNHAPIFLRLAWSDAVSYDHTLDPERYTQVPDNGTAPYGGYSSKNTHHPTGLGVGKGWPGCGGCNGSIRFISELHDANNAGLNYAIEMLAPFKQKYKLLSWADLIQMSGVAVIYVSGGPYIDLRYGRMDCPIDLRDPNEDPKEAYRGWWNRGGCPLRMNSEDMKLRYFPTVYPPYPLGEKTTISHLRILFQRLGLNNRDAVALCGAHTIGRAFKNRTGVCDSLSGDGNGPIYTKTGSIHHGRDPEKLKTSSGISGGNLSFCSSILV